MAEKNTKRVFSKRTRNNIILDMALLVGGLISVLSGIYFLFLPIGGYQGGRNALYGIIIFFERHTWGDVHTWSSVAIIALAALHVPLHWQWIVKMTRTGFRNMFGKSKLNNNSQFNLFINILTGLSGLVCGLSGLYFLFLPVTPTWIFTPLVWDLIHTWSGVVMTAVGILHFGIHWKWVVKVLGKYGKALISPKPTQRFEPSLRTSAVRVDDSI